MYKYVFYCICSKYEELLSRKEGARGDLNSSRILSLKIPVPSLERQNHIVTILDRFDTLCNSISSGIPAEIELRTETIRILQGKIAIVLKKNQRYKYGKNLRRNCRRAQKKR